MSEPFCENEPNGSEDVSHVFLLSSVEGCLAWAWKSTKHFMILTCLAFLSQQTCKPSFANGPTQSPSGLIKTTE